MTIHPSQNMAIIAVSVIVAIPASFTALSLAGRHRVASGVARAWWLAAAAFALGGGICRELVWRRFLLAPDGMRRNPQGQRPATKPPSAPQCEFPRARQTRPSGIA